MASSIDKQFTDETLQDVIVNFEENRKKDVPRLMKEVWDLYYAGELSHEGYAKAVRTLYGKFPNEVKAVQSKNTQQKSKLLDRIAEVAETGYDLTDVALEELPYGLDIPLGREHSYGVSPGSVAAVISDWDGSTAYVPPNVDYDTLLHEGQHKAFGTSEETQRLLDYFINDGGMKDEAARYLKTYKDIDLTDASQREKAKHKLINSLLRMQKYSKRPGLFSGGGINLHESLGRESINSVDIVSHLSEDNLKNFAQSMNAYKPDYGFSGHMVSTVDLPDRGVYDEAVLAIRKNIADLLK